MLPIGYFNKDTYIGEEKKEKAQYQAGFEPAMKLLLYRHATTTATCDLLLIQAISSGW